MPRKKQIGTETHKRSLESQGFYSDYFRDGLLYAKLIRSPASTGSVKSITVPELPEGYAFFTADDIPGKKEFTINKTQIKLFGYGYVTYTGEPLGILVGPDKYTVDRLIDEVSVFFDIETLEAAFKNVMKIQKRPVVKISPVEELSQFVTQLNELPSLDSEDALETEPAAGTSEQTSVTSTNAEMYDTEDEEILAERIIRTGYFLHNYNNNNPEKNNSENNSSNAVGDKSDKTDKKESANSPEKPALVNPFSEAKYISQAEYKQKITSTYWQETNGAFCCMDGKNLHVYCPTKWTASLLNTISETLGIKKEQIFIHKTVNQGVNTNGLWRTTQLAAQVAVASYLTKKPVKLMLSYAEQEQFFSPSVDAANHQRIALDEKGHIKAMEIDISIDAGTANPFAQEIADRMSLLACSYYKPENLLVRTKVHTSKKPPTSLYISNIDAQPFFAIENHMQKLSDISHIYPDDLRYENSINSNVKNFPFNFDCAGIQKTIQETIRISDFNRKLVTYKMDAVNRTLKKSNPFFALPLKGIGIATAFNSSGYLGNSLFSSEQKIEVTLTTDNEVHIKAVMPSQTIQTIWKNTASEILQIDKSKIFIDSQYELEEIPEYPEESGSNLSIINILLKKCCSEIQRKRFHQPLPITSKKGISTAMKKSWDKESFTGKPFNSTSFATAVVELELDTYTYSEKIKGIWITIDCGEIFDKKAAVHAVRLEIQQELTKIVKEKTVSCNKCVVSFIESKEKSGQINGLVHNTIPAAFSSALSLALTTQMVKLPCTENEIFRLMKERESKNANGNQKNQNTNSINQEADADNESSDNA